MKQNSECICDDNGIEVLVSYEYEKEPAWTEECHGTHDVGELIYTELKTVELVVAGRGIEILSRLTEKEKSWIISKLQYAA